MHSTPASSRPTERYNPAAAAACQARGEPVAATEEILLEQPLAKRSKLESPLGASSFTSNAIFAGYGTSVSFKEIMELRKMEHEELLALESTAREQEITKRDMEATKRHLADHETQRMKEVEQTKRSTTSATRIARPPPSVTLDFFGVVDRHTPKVGQMPIVSQAISQSKIDNEHPKEYTPKTVLFRLNRFAERVMFTDEGTQYKFRRAGRAFLCTEGKGYLMCASPLQPHVLSELMREARCNPDGFAWPKTSVLATAITTELPLMADAIDWRVRAKNGKILVALVVKLDVPAELREATNNRLVVFLARSENVTILGEPPVVYATDKSFNCNFPLGLQRALVAENPEQAMADLNPFRMIGDAHRQIAIELQSTRILSDAVTKAEWVRALDVSKISEKFLTMTARPGHWGKTGGEYVPLSEWIKHVFIGAGGSYFNILVGTVMNASAKYLPIRRKEEKRPILYCVSDYENICKVYSICHTINNLPDTLSDRIKKKFGDARS
jgi:hypothetical protein